MSEHQGLPVAGYRAQTTEAVSIVNEFKKVEERILRTLDGLARGEMVDRRWLAIGRTQLEQAFMAINRSVFQPARVTFPGDTASTTEDDGA